jgi:hypothetical protein
VIRAVEAFVMLESLFSDMVTPYIKYRS